MLVGEDPASQVYVQQQGGGLRQGGHAQRDAKLPAATTEAELLAALIDSLNHDAAIHGILVQLPLPKHIAEKKVLEAVAAHKMLTASMPKTSAH